MIAFRLKTILLAIIGVALFGLGIFTGYKLFAPKPAPQTVVNAQAILTALHDRGFLVTQTYIFDTPVTIERSTGSAFQDFFLGQTIEARGTMEVNMGIDLAQVKEEDVILDGAEGTVTVNLPGSTLFNTRLVGPIEVKNRQGILKRVLDHNDGYNEALSALSKAAEASAAKPELIQRADDRAREDVRRLIQYVTRGTVVEVETGR